MLSKEEIKQLESEGVTFKTNYFKSIDNRLFRKYGINLADYEDLLEEQGGVCLKRKLSGIWRDLLMFLAVILPIQNKARLPRF